MLGRRGLTPAASEALFCVPADWPNQIRSAKETLGEAVASPLTLFEIARMFVHLDHYKKPHDSENRTAFIRHYPRPRRLTTQPLRDQPHANCLCLRKKHARERRV